MLQSLTKKLYKYCIILLYVQVNIQQAAEKTHNANVMLLMEQHHESIYGQHGGTTLVFLISLPTGDLEK